MPYILIVDDEPAIQALLQLLVEAAGHRVQCASNGAAALELVRAEEPAALILDLNIPGTSGWEVAATLKEEAPHIPILVITGRYNTPDEAIKAVPGSTDALIKPFDPEAVLGALERLLADRPSQTLR